MKKEINEIDPNVKTIIDDMIKKKKKENEILNIGHKDDD